MRLVTDEYYEQTHGSSGVVLLKGDPDRDHDIDDSDRPAPPAESLEWPHEVDLILSALDAAAYNGVWFDDDRRRGSRQQFRKAALLMLHSDPCGAPGWELFTRDCDSRGVGFITHHRLPLGYSGVIEIQAPTGEMTSVQCLVIRCRPAANGWYEGAVRFSKTNPAFLA